MEPAVAATFLTGMDERSRRSSTIRVISDSSRIMVDHDMAAAVAVGLAGDRSAAETEDMFIATGASGTAWGSCVLLLNRIMASSPDSTVPARNAYQIICRIWAMFRRLR